MGFFVGQVMKASGGRANPQIINKLLRDVLEGEDHQG
jgi:aspartyl-tRNA(Asn)/glutamyl-tRNA(Gln) amidotransferase subunit B